MKNLLVSNFLQCLQLLMEDSNLQGLCIRLVFPEFCITQTTG